LPPLLRARDDTARADQKQKWNQKPVARRGREVPRAVAERTAGANRLALIRAFCARRGRQHAPRTHPAQNIFRTAKPPMSVSTRARKCARAAAIT
jgi:hypothetical protein